jgi:hypothetical protein
MEPASALPAESPALQRCAMGQLVEAYFGIAFCLQSKIASRGGL